MEIDGMKIDWWNRPYHTQKKEKEF